MNIIDSTILITHFFKTFHRVVCLMLSGIVFCLLLGFLLNWVIGHVFVIKSSSPIYVILHLEGPAYTRGSC